MARTARTGLGDSRTADSFELVRRCIVLFGAIGGIVLGTVCVMAFTGHRATAFMWIRGAVLPAAAPLIHRLAVRASEGSSRAFDRLRTLSAVLPIAIIGVDLVPGLCPPWYAVLQGLSALALVGVALVSRGSALRGAFPAGDAQS